MNVTKTIAETRRALRSAPRPVGFVPTMGALHEGHLSLVRAARERSETVVVSVFVNPLQFGPTEDFARYPREEETDLAAADDAGVDVVFMPSVSEMYPGDRATTVTVGGGITNRFEGEIRPGHFDGVATVVAKLFGIVDPDLAFFGQKDAQQLAVVRRMVVDLSMRVEIVGCDTIRERDGLAMSSRNAYLSARDRDRARSLWAALQAGAEALRSGSDETGAAAAMRTIVERETDVVDYAAVVDPDTFEDPGPGGKRLLIVAARVGGTRLIDNLLMEENR